MFPKANGVYGAGEPVNFQANVDTGKTQPPAPPVISWTVTSDADKKKTAIGKGARVSKRLEAGKYEAEVTVEVAGQKGHQEGGVPCRASDAREDRKPGR